MSHRPPSPANPLAERSPAPGTGAEAPGSSGAGWRRWLGRPGWREWRGWTPWAVRPDLRIALALGAGALAVYVRTLLPGVGYSGDTAKWQFLGEVGGTPHPTGYPLYLLLNRAWVTAVPVGELAWRVNLLSAVLGAATVALLYLLLRQLGIRPLAAGATAATFALTFTFWSQAVVAEVYTLHLLFLTAVTVCLARWLAGAPDRWLLAGLGLYAASFGHHLGTVLALPGVAWLLWRGRRRLRWPVAAWTGLFAVLAAAQYAYLLRMTAVGAYVEQPVHDLGDIAHLVTGGRFRRQMFTFGPGELVRDRLPLLGRFLRRELGVLLVPAAYGAVRVARAGPDLQRAVAVHLGLLGVLAAVYSLNFDVPDVVVFFLPCGLVLAVLLGAGLDGVAALVGDGRWRWAAAAGLALVPVVTGLVNYRDASQRGNRGDAQRIERAIEAAGTGAVLITDNYADSEYLWYYLLGEGVGAERDLTLVHMLSPRQVLAFFEQGRGPLAAVATGDTPVYTATPHQALDLARAGLRVTPVADDVWRVAAAP